MKNNQLNLGNMNYDKILFLFVIMSFLISIGSAQEISITSPLDGEIYNQGDYLNISVGSKNTDSVQRTLKSSSIQIEDEAGNSFYESKTQETDVTSGETYNHEFNLEPSKVEEELDFGSLSIQASDTWDGGTPISDAADINFQETESFYEITIIESSSSLVEGENIVINVRVENTGDADGLKKVTASGGSLGSSSKSISLDNGDSGNYEFSIGTDIGDAGSYTIDVSSEDDSVSTGVTIDEEADDFNQDGEYQVSVSEPNTDYLHENSSDLIIEWTSNNDWTEERTLESSDIVVLDQEGREYSESLSRSLTVSSGSSVLESVALSSGDLESNLEYSGEWSVQVIDNWEDDSIDNYVYFDTFVESSGEDSTQEDDNTTDDGSDVIVDEGNDGDDPTDDSTDDNTSDDGSSDNSADGSTDDNTTDDSTDEASTDCPDGFSYDEENDVCLEDAGDGSDSGSSDGTSSDRSSNEGDSGDDDVDGGSDDSSADGGSSTEVDDSEATGAASILGNEVSGVPLWIPGLILLVTGILFWRSDYEFDF